MKNRISDLRLDKGWSQAHLAELLGVTRQTVNALEASKSDPGLNLAMKLSWLFQQPVESIFLPDLDEQMSFLNEPWERTERRATAFNEIKILHKMGLNSWEMTGFGVNVLQFRRPKNPSLRRAWRYERLKGLLSTARRSELETDGWLFSGSWMNVFHYFKKEAEQSPSA